MTVNGIHLNVETAGAGPPLVLLHGFTGSAATWEAHVGRLAPRRFTIAIGQLGHGQSDAPAEASRYSIGHAVEDVLGVLDRLQLSRASVLGYSMGGRVALALAILAPERLTAVILESTSPGLTDAAERGARARRDAELADSIERDGVAAFVEQWEKLPLWASQARLSAEIQAQLRAQRLQHTPAGLANTLRGLGQGAQPPVHDFLPSLRLPVLLLAGALDPAYCDLARKMSGLIPTARLEIVPDAGHAVHLEQPEAFCRLVLEFLDQVATTRSPQIAP